MSGHLTCTSGNYLVHFHVLQDKCPVHFFMDICHYGTWIFCFILFYLSNALIKNLNKCVFYCKWYIFFNCLLFNYLMLSNDLKFNSLFLTFQSIKTDCNHIFLNFVPTLTLADQNKVLYLLSFHYVSFAIFFSNNLLLKCSEYSSFLTWFWFENIFLKYCPIFLLAT